jgi:hypothetical protein
VVLQCSSAVSTYGLFGTQLGGLHEAWRHIGERNAQRFSYVSLIGFCSSDSLLTSALVSLLHFPRRERSESEIWELRTSEGMRKEDGRVAQIPDRIDWVFDKNGTQVNGQLPRHLFRPDGSPLDREALVLVTC